MKTKPRWIQWLEIALALALLVLVMAVFLALILVMAAVAEAQCRPQDHACLAEERREDAEMTKRLDAIAERLSRDSLGRASQAEERAAQQEFCGQPCWYPLCCLAALLE